MIFDSKTDAGRWRRWVYQRLKNVSGTEGIELGDLQDVGDATPNDKNFLIADGDSWEAAAHILDDHTDVTISGVLDEEALVFNSATGRWENTEVQLPSVTVVQGGDAASAFTEQDVNPWGTSGSGGTGLPNGGTEGQLLIKDSSVDGDASWQTFGAVAASATEYCPNYTSYTRVSDSAFTIDLVNAAALFRTGRRVKFSQSGNFDYGVVSAVDYNSTAANDTHVTLTMEGSDTVPTGTFDVCLVTSGTAWSPIAADPFGGTAIRGIATGPLSGTQWWVAVGDGGKLFTSTDAGVTWTSRTSGTTGDLLCVTYNARDAEFMVGGETTGSAGALLLKSTTGTSWSSVSIPWVDGANDYVKSISYSYPGQYYCCSVWDDSTTTHDTNLSLDSYATFTPRQSVANGGKVAAMESPNGIIDDWYIANATITQLYINFGDGSGATSHSHGVAVTALSFEYNNGEGASNQFSGDSSGRIYYSGDLDDATFSNPIRDFATAEIHQRTVCVGDSGTIGYIADANLENADAWVSVANGFAPTANVLCVEFNETDGVFVACADNGQICRSSNGIA